MSCNDKQFGVFQVRRGPSSLFSSSNIVLASGEPAYAIDTKTFKIGDGVTPWNNLTSPSGVGIGGTTLINNSGDNRVLTSDGTTTGINAESYLTYNNTYNILSIGSGSPLTSILNLYQNIDDDSPATINLLDAYSAPLLTISSRGDATTNSITSNSYPLDLYATNGIAAYTNSSFTIHHNSSIFGFDGKKVFHNNGDFTNFNDSSHITYVTRRTTTDASSNVVLTLNGNVPDSTNRLSIAPQTAWTFSIKLSAYNSTDHESAWWHIRGGIKRNNSNQTVLVGSIITENGSETTLNSALATVVADDTNEALEIRVTGVSSKTIRWVAVVDISQVSFGTP